MLTEVKVKKLRLYENNKIVIENFENLYEIDESLIVIDHYIIEGSFLKINMIKDDIIEIIGTIQEIKITE